MDIPVRGAISQSEWNQTDIKGSMKAEKPHAQAKLLSPTEKCKICNEQAAKHIHYGAMTCFSCRAFFRRSIQNKTAAAYACRRNKDCEINLKTRKNCQFCRYQKCIRVGMKPTWVLSEEERERRFRKVREKNHTGGEKKQRNNSYVEDEYENLGHVESPGMMCPVSSDGSDLYTETVLEDSGQFSSVENTIYPVQNGGGVGKIMDSTSLNVQYIKVKSEQTEQPCAMSPTTFQMSKLEVKEEPNLNDVRLLTHSPNLKSRPSSVPSSVIVQSTLPQPFNHTGSTYTALSNDSLHGATESLDLLQFGQRKDLDSLDDHDVVDPDIHEIRKIVDLMESADVSVASSHSNQSSPVLSLVSQHTDNNSRQSPGYHHRQSPGSPGYHHRQSPGSPGYLHRQSPGSTSLCSPSIINQNLHSPADPVTIVANEFLETCLEEDEMYSSSEEEYYPCPLVYSKTPEILFSPEEKLYLDRLVSLHNDRYRSVNFGEELIKEMIMCSMFGIPISTTAAINGYRLSIERVSRIAYSMDDFTTLSTVDQTALLKENSDLLVSLRGAIFFDSQKKGTEQVLISMGIEDMDKIRSMFSQVLTEDSMKHIDYKTFNSVQSVGQNPTEDRYNFIQEKVGKLLMDDTVTVLLTFIVLFSPDFCVLSNQSKVQKTQSEYIRVLQRYIYSKYPRYLACFKLANTLDIITYIREMAEIKKRRAVAANVKLN